MTKRVVPDKRKPRPTPLQRLMGKVEFVGDCWMFRGGMSGSGYGAIWGLHGKQTGAHQLSYEIHYGPIPDGKEICHTCDNKLCVNPRHLFAGTRQENVDDMIAKGRMVVGANLHRRPQDGINNHNARLNLDQVLTVKEMVRAGFRQAEIMRRTKVSRANVWSIVHEKSWSGVGFDTAAPELIGSFIEEVF